MLKRSSFCAALIALGLLASAVSARQEDAITRTVLQKAEFPGTQYATVMVMVEIKPGATAARHSHPGIEMSYVIEGNGELAVEGQPARSVKAGDVFNIAAGIPHSFTNPDRDKSSKILVTYVVEKDKPIATAVPE